MSTPSTFKKLLQTLIIRPFNHTYTIRTRHYQVLPLVLLLAVVACCVYALVLVVVHKSLLAVPVLCVVIAGCGWCTWAFVEKDEVDEELVEKAGVNGIAVISAPMMGLKEVLVR
ncbi:uncharacterized protein H6S33_010789 [Morchella sextelata]|jgi:ABC-type bacteriocin/lantibiotic exporter with double-glycine peptidase domain|uniref:uncharacterized protein n=1 Tax=Morchella sextelata TaxID=1174677 RepID=UPI001D0440CA|nr:uncharacterized protein H6S33_010789 [Morchella sextelata]KAH0611524.1 hypothetical protein H6S33_010789 [Morchella sextelata]